MTSTLETRSAFCDHDVVEIAGATAGDLLGRTFAVKDVFDVAGTRCCAGSPDWLRSHEPSIGTAPTVQRLLDAGATLRGKTKSDELMYSISGKNAHYGTPMNPHAPGRIPGGSSSGSASVVASGEVDFSIGTDTTGSVRTPASLCGLWGLRVSHGNISTHGVLPLAPTFDTVGAFARDPGLLLSVYDILLDCAHADVDWRRAVMPMSAWSSADPEVREVLDGPVKQFTKDLEVAAADPPTFDLLSWSESVRVLQASEAWSVLGHWIDDVNPELGSDIAKRIDAARRTRRVDASDARSQLAQGRAWIRSVVGNDSIIIIPTTPSVAPRITSTSHELDAWRSRVMQLMSIANVAGLPQLAIPAAVLGGLPVSFSIIGPPNSELALLTLARERHLT